MRWNVGLEETIERLTIKSIFGGWTIHVPRQEAVDRLAAYEDTIQIERAQELAQAEKDGRLISHLPGEKVFDRFGTPWVIESSEIHLIQGELKQIFRCGHPGAEDYCAMYDDEILTREEAEAALKKRMEAGNEAN